MKKLNKKNKVENQLYFYVSGGTNETCTNPNCGGNGGGSSNPPRPMGGTTSCYN